MKLLLRNLVCIIVLLRNKNLYTLSDPLICFYLCVFEIKRSIEGTLDIGGYYDIGKWLLYTIWWIVSQADARLKLGRGKDTLR